MRTHAMSSPLLLGSFALFLVFMYSGPAAAQICVQPPEGLVSWWPGEGNANDITSGNHGTLQNGATFAAGIVGEALSFDGVDDYVRIPHHPSLNPASALTIEAWIHSASTEGPRVIVSKWGNFDDSYIFKDHNDSDKLRIELSETVLPDLADLAGSTSIPLGTWVHVTTTYDATEGTVRLYFNGREDASLFVGLGRLIHSSLTDVLIGAFEGTMEEGVIEHFAGLIDEVSIYNRALTASEIQAIFNAGSAGKCKGVPLVPLAAQTTLSVSPQGADDTFALQAAFILGDGSNGIDPLTEAVTLQVGTTAFPIPVGTFQRTSAGAFRFEGVLGGVTLHFTITPLTHATVEVVAHGEGAALTGIAVPVEVGLTIGNDSGSTTLPIAEVSAQRPPPQR
jgi:hypothetical protein